VLGVLLDQLDGAWELLDARLTGRRPWSDDAPNPDAFLTDDEYFWEAVPGCWSLRPRGKTIGPRPVGRGEWLLDEAEHSPRPAPFTTIAWRMCHICESPLVRYDYTFGTHSLTLDDVGWPGTARDAVAFVGTTHRRWRDALATLDPEDAFTVGLCQNPSGLDATVRFIDLLAWTNTEFTHHAAEIACLRDLYRARSRAA
jgi:hypothetical protein